MSPNRRPSDPPKSTPITETLGRRRFIALGATLGTAVVAGCAASAPESSGNDGSTEEQAGHFRLLISDQPVAIDEFDSLVVHLDRARVFRAEDEDEDEAEGEMEPTDSPEPTETPESTESPTPTETPEPTETPTPTETPEPTELEGEEEAEKEDDEEDFFVIDLEGESVDLTRLVGEKAENVFEGPLPAGRYAKIELYADGVEGIVDGADVDVKIPSGKLQIIKPFEVEAGETVTFVFDITVVRKGPSGGYNLIPVISKSGVAGEEVAVQEVDQDGNPVGADGDPVDDANGEETETDEDDREGPPSEASIGGPTDTPEA